VNGGDFRVAVPSNIMMRIRPRFTDCVEWGWTTGSATSQPPVLLSSAMLGLPGLFMPRPGESGRPRRTWSYFLCSHQSGTASIQYRNQSFTWPGPIIVWLFGVAKPPLSN